jgi:hypothetical protein
MNPPGLAMPVRGASYSIAMRAVATTVALALATYAARSWQLIAAAGEWSSPSALMLLAAALGMVGSWFFMLRSVTIIDQHGIRQTGLIEKKMAWSDMRAVRVARWGVARLIVRGERGSLIVFFGGTNELRAAFNRIAGAHAR